MKGRANALVVIALLTLGGGPAAASDAGPATVQAPPPEAPAVNAAVSSSEVVLGQDFILYVRVERRAGMQLNLPAVLPLGGALEELRRTSSDETGPDGTTYQIFEVALQAFLVGDIAVPPIPVVYTVDGRTAEVATQPVPLRVIGVIGDGEGKLRDIAPPMAVETVDWTLVYAGIAAGGLVVLLLLILVVVRILRRRRMRPGRSVRRALRMEQQLSPHEEALRRLDKLEASGVIDSGTHLKRAYLELSEIVRAYLGRRYGFLALDLTTSELMERLDDSADGKEALDLLGDWLERCDLVKFAGTESSADEARRALYDARQFVQATTPQPGGTDA